MEKEKISYFVHESITMKLERTIKRLWILCIVIFVSFVVSNAMWICYVSQFDDEITTVSQDIDTGNNGGDAVVTGTGDINYGTNTTDSND